MKKVLQQTLFRLKTFLLLAVMFIVGSSAAWAQDATYSLTVKSGSGRYTSTVDENGLQYSYYSWNSKANTYGNGNIIWFSSPDKPISKIVFTYASGQGDVYPSSTDNYPWSDLGTFDQSSYTWTAPAGGATYVSFRGIDDIYFTSADVWFDGSADDGSVKATLSFAGTLNSYYNESGVQTSLGGGDNFYGGGYFLFDNGAKMTFNTSGSNGWSNSAQRIRISSGCSFTVSAPEGYELTAIDFTTDGTNSLEGLSTPSGLTKQSNQKATWVGKADNVVFTTTAITFITTMKVTLMPVAEEGEIIYTIDFVDAPTGAYVTLDGETFDSNDTYTVEKNFGKNDLEAYEPEGYYAEVEYTRDNHTYTVTYHAYNYYDVTVTGTTDPAAGVVYNETTYHNGDRIETKDVLSESSVEPVDVAGYNVELTFANGEFKVAYTEKPVQGVPWEVNVASIFNDCTVVDSNSDGSTWTNNGDDIYYPYNTYNSANDYIILPAVRLEAGKTYTVGVECHQLYSYSEKLEVLYGTSNNVAGMTKTAIPAKNVTWNDYTEITNDFSVTADGVYYFAIHAVSPRNLYNLYVKKFSIKEPEPRQCVMDVKSTFFSTGNVEQISSGLTFVADVNTEGEHSGYNGSSNEVPAGVILEDGNGTSYTISSMLWWNDDSQVVLNLPSAITAPGHYTLTIPEGVIPCVGNKANKEIVFEWTIAEPTTYTVTFSDGAPAGASVTIDGNTYTTSTTFQSHRVLDEYSANVSDVEGYEASVTYDEDNKEFIITYTALEGIDYYISINPKDDANLKIRINGKECGAGTYTFYKEITAEDIETPEYEGYYANPIVEIEDEFITVTYTAFPTLAIGVNASDNEGNYWTSFSFEKPFSLPEGVTPCIVTGAENGVLTVQEFKIEDNEASTYLDFRANTVFESLGRMFDESGNEADVTVRRSGGDINTSSYGGYLHGTSSNPVQLTISAPTIIRKIVVTPYGGGYGANVSINGGEITTLTDGKKIYEVNATECTLDFTSYSYNDIYITGLEIVVGDQIIPVIPANTGILVKSNESKDNIAYTVHEAGEENVDVTSNLLVAGCDPEAVWDDANKLFYKLSWKNSSYEDLGFYWGVEGGHSITPSQNKAYLVLDAPAGAESNRAFVFGGYEEVLTGIDSVSAVSNAPIFNLQGKRVSRENLSAGVYVKNGKKFIVK